MIYFFVYDSGHNFYMTQKGFSKIKKYLKFLL